MIVSVSKEIISINILHFSTDKPDKNSKCASYETKFSYVKDILFNNCFSETIYILKDVNNSNYSSIWNSNFLSIFIINTSTYSFNFIISLFFECNLAHNSLFDKQRFLLIMGVVKFRSFSGSLGGRWGI